MGLWEQQVADWNARFPLDRWWRQRHGVTFRSPQHLKTSPVAIRYEYEEDKLFNRWTEEAKKRALEREEMEATGVWLNPPLFAKTTEAEAKAVYDDIGDDLSQFDDVPDDEAEASPEPELEEDVTL